MTPLTVERRLAAILSSEGHQMCAAAGAHEIPLIHPNPGSIGAPATVI